MKVLQINNFHYLRGGSEKVYLDTCRLLENMGHHVMHFSSHHKENIPSPYSKYFVGATDLFEKTSIPKKIKKGLNFIYSIEAAQKLDRLLSTERPDIAHLHIFQSRLTSAILPVLRAHKIPVVMSVHEYKMLCPIYSMVDTKHEVCEICPSRGSQFHVVIKKCNRNSRVLSLVSYLESQIRDRYFPYHTYVDKFLGVSDFVVNKHLTYKPELRGKMDRLYNFVDLDIYHPGGEKQDYYMFVGRLSYEKGIRIMLKAWKDHPEKPLVIVGDGPERSWAESFVKENNLTKVHFAGFVPPNELVPMLQRAKYLVSPSVTYETFGLSLIEAMACGTPVIAAEIGGMTELITHGMNGLQFESGNCNSLSSALTVANNLSDKGYQDMRQSGLTFVEDSFGIEKHYRQLIRHYESVLNPSEVLPETV